MVRVLRIINRFNLGGPTYNVSYLARYMDERFETMLIGGPEEAGESSSLHITESLGIKPVIIHELNRNVSVLKDLYAFFAIRKIIRQFRPHIVHTHASKAGAVGRLAAISCKVPIIVHTFHGHVFHSYFGKFKTKIFKSIERFLAKRSTAIIAISPLQKQELVTIHKICTPQQTVVIPLGFDLKRFHENREEKRKSFRNQLGLNDSTLAIGIIGRLAPVKDHRLFIDAMLNAQSVYKGSICGIIIGDGETKDELRDYMKENNIPYSEKDAQKPAFIHFAGWRTDVDVVLSGLDLVTLTSKNEGTPVSLIEAQAAGKYIISTNAGGIKDILHPDCGKVSNTRNEFMSDLAEALAQFESLSKQAEQGINYAQQHFGYRRLVKDMEELYNRLLTEKGIQE
jgi:glycosyltransferase involved in cell wall biosynthesis